MLIVTAAVLNGFSIQLALKVRLSTYLRKIKFIGNHRDVKLIYAVIPQARKRHAQGRPSRSPQSVIWSPIQRVAYLSPIGLHNEFFIVA